MKKLLSVGCLFLLLFSCRTQETEKTKNDVVVKSDKADIISYVIKDRKGGNHSFTIDTVKKTAILILPNDHDVNLTEVLPSITISKGATISPNAEQKCDFSAEKKVLYTLTSESGKTKEYTVSVVVLPARKNLEVESIKVYDVLVVNKKVTIDEKYSTVRRSNIEVNFKGEATPSDFYVEPEVLYLNSKADEGAVTLSTPKTDRWNAWTETITVKRGGEKHKLSSECKIEKFVANGVEADIDENAKTVHCVLPPNTENTSVTPIITCSKGAFISPNSGKTQDFSKGPVTYTVKSEDLSKTQTYSITVERGKSNIAKILSFKIGTVMAKIDEENKKITAEVEKSVSLTSIAPKIEVSKAAVVNPASDVPKDFTDSEANPVQYVVTAEDGHTTQTYSITITHKKSTEANIISFKIGSIVAKIDEPSRKITAEVEKTQALNAITPEITVSEGATVEPKTNTLQDFTNPVTYTVTAENRKTTKKYEVTITHKKSTEAEITSFKVGDVKANIEQSTGKITLKVENSVALNKIKPEIEISKGASISPASLEEKDFTASDVDPVKYTVTAEDKHTTKVYNVSITHKSSEAKITSFKVAGIALDIDEATGAITKEVEKTLSLDSVVPEIKVSDGATISPKADVAQNFNSPVTYTVKSEDEKTTKQYIVNITRKKSNIATMKSFVVDKTQPETTKANISQDEKTIYAIVPFNTDLSNITPLIECDDDATCEPASESVCDFSNGKTVIFTVKSEDEKVTSEYTARIKRLPPETTITIFDVEAKSVGQGKMSVEIPKDKDKIEIENIKLTYKDGNETKEIESDKIRIEGDQGTLAGENGSMVLRIILNLGPEFITDADMEITVTKKQG